MSINDNVEWVYIRDEHKSQTIKRRKNKSKQELYWNQREFMLSEFDVNIKPKSMYKYDNKNEKFWWWNDITNTKPVEMTVALPALNADKIIWLALESLKNQININFAWELIVFEEEGISKKIVQSYKGLLPGCVRIIYKIITKEDALYKIEDIKKNKCTSYYTLLEKWINMAKIADNNSKIFVKHAVDCYSSPKRLYIHYEHFKNDMCYYSTQPKGYFYNINQDKWLLYNGYKLEPIKWNEYGERKLKYLNDNFKDDKNIKVRGCHLNMATRTELVKKLSFSKNPLRSGIDSYLLSEICKIIKKRPEEEKIIFTDDEIDKDNWKYSLDTDGNNNISHFRKDLYTKNTYDFFKIVDERNECYINPYIISSLRIVYLKNTNEILPINKKILINKQKLNDKLKEILNHLKLGYDVFKSYKNQNLENYFLVIDSNYNEKLYIKTIQNKIYYSCHKPKNNHIIKNVSLGILKKIKFRIQCLQKYNINNLFDIIKNRKVLICSIWDYGFSAYNLFTSLKCENIDVDYFTFNVEYRNKVLNRNEKITNSINLIDIDVNNYDVLLFKEDYNLSDLNKVKVLDTNYDILNTFNKDNRIIKINIVCGSFYRNGICLSSDCPKNIALNTINIDNKILDYDFVCGLTHDLCYYFDSLFFGHKQLKTDYSYILNDNNIITISHSPSNKAKKGTELIISAINNLKKKYNIKFVLIENVSQEESIKIKKKSQLFIDQLYAEGYGNSLIEASCFGIPCMANVNVNPILNINSLNVEENIESFITLSKKEKLILSRDTYNYYLKYHTFSLSKINYNTNQRIMSIFS